VPTVPLVFDTARSRVDLPHLWNTQEHGIGLRQLVAGRILLPCGLTTNLRMEPLELRPDNVRSILGRGSIARTRSVFERFSDEDET